MTRRRRQEGCGPAGELALLAAFGLVLPGALTDPARAETAFQLHDQVIGCVDPALARAAADQVAGAVARHRGCHTLAVGGIWEKIGGADGVWLLRRTPPRRWLPPLFVAVSALEHAARRLPESAADPAAGAASETASPVLLDPPAPGPSPPSAAPTPTTVPSIPMRAHDSGVPAARVSGDMGAVPAADTAGPGRAGTGKAGTGVWAFGRSLALSSSYKIGFALALAMLLLPIGLAVLMFRLLLSGRAVARDLAASTAGPPGEPLPGPPAGLPPLRLQDVARPRRSVMPPAPRLMPPGPMPSGPTPPGPRLPALVPSELASPGLASPGLGARAAPVADVVLRRASAIVHQSGWEGSLLAQDDPALGGLVARHGEHVVAVCRPEPDAPIDEDLIEYACVLRERCHADLVLVLSDRMVRGPIRELAAQLGVVLGDEGTLRDLLNRRH